ncbi:cellulase family glycosylhydrolase [Cryptosporangium phraense]|uniref:cellulase family glycosylhydrolase n=1 Tax=Cryptosporangium phraense TaxID=2593070 RepID=UPI0014796F66|nr:cellulase family glycosylhydrolase [Cryptosporangium phraense]
MNVWNAATDFSESARFCGDPSNLDVDASSFGPGVQVVRTWFFQRLATTSDGRRDWSGLDGIVAAARRHRLKIIAVLGNQWADCEGYPSAEAGYKTDAWYRAGYRDAPPPGQPATYREWVREVAERYRHDPTIMIWQLVNEPEPGASLGGACPPSAAGLLRNFTADVGGLLHAVDPYHLVSVGTAGSGQCGAVDREWEALHRLPVVDVAEYHDYAVEELPGDRWNGLAARLRQAAALGKPLIVGEMGVRADRVGGVDERGAVIGRKIAAQERAGVAGVLLWSWRGGSAGGSGASGYEIGPGDPALKYLDLASN